MKLIECRENEKTFKSEQYLSMRLKMRKTQALRRLARRSASISDDRIERPSDFRLSISLPVSFGLKHWPLSLVQLRQTATLNALPVLIGQIGGRTALLTRKTRSNRFNTFALLTGGLVVDLNDVLLFVHIDRLNLDHWVVVLIVRNCRLTNLTAYLMVAFARLLTARFLIYRLRKSRSNGHLITLIWLLLTNLNRPGQRRVLDLSVFRRNYDNLDVLQVRFVLHSDRSVLAICLQKPTDSLGLMI